MPRIAVFRSKAGLRAAVKACIKISSIGNCPKGPHGPIEDWDVSAVTDMADMFSDTPGFNGDISQWDVSNVADMSGMFADATFFNGDISQWDVSSVNDMSGMFENVRHV